MATKAADGTLGVDHEEPEIVAAVIDFDEFQADYHDETWRRAMHVALEHVEALERDGRNR